MSNFEKLFCVKHLNQTRFRIIRVDDLADDDTPISDYFRWLDPVTFLYVDRWNVVMHKHKRNSDGKAGSATIRSSWMISIAVNISIGDREWDKDDSDERRMSSKMGMNSLDNTDNTLRHSDRAIQWHPSKSGILPSFRERDNTHQRHDKHSYPHTRKLKHQIPQISSLQWLARTQWEKRAAPDRALYKSHRTAPYIRGCSNPQPHPDSNAQSTRIEWALEDSLQVKRSAHLHEIAKCRCGWRSCWAPRLNDKEVTKYANKSRKFDSECKKKKAVELHQAQPDRIHEIIFLRRLTILRNFGFDIHFIIKSDKSAVAFNNT